VRAGRWPGRDWLFVTAFIALLLLTRLPFMAEYLYEWDSIQFALGLEEYNVPLHHPHPPGYPFYILAARAVNLLLRDAADALSALSLVFSCCTIVAVYALGRELAGRQTAITASIVLFFAPVFWLYGEISTIYAAEGMWSALVAFACYRAAKGGAGWAVISAVLLGVAGGFRANIILFLLPLWLYCVLRGGRGRGMLVPLLALILSVLSWLLPLLLLFGRDYMDASRLLYGYSNITSVFTDPAGLWLTNAAKAVLYTFYGFGPLCCILLLCLLASALAGGKRRELPLPFFLWWILPPFCYYFLLHIKKPGYTLTYVPGLALLLALLFCRLPSRRRSPALLTALAASLALNMAMLFPPRRGGIAMALATGRGRFSLRRLEDKGGAMEAIVLLRERGMDRRTAVLSLNNGYTKFASYYLPECRVYHSDFVRLKPVVVYHGRKVVAASDNGVIALIPEIDEIAVIGPTESMAFDDPGIKSEEICSEPPVTVFRLSPRFREVVYGQDGPDGGRREVVIRRECGL